MIPLQITRRSLLKTWLGLGICVVADLRERNLAIAKATSTEALFESGHDLRSADPQDAADEWDWCEVEFKDQMCERCDGTGYLDEPWYLLQYDGPPHPCERCRGSGYLSIEGRGYLWGPGGNGWI